MNNIPNLSVRIDLGNSQSRITQLNSSLNALYNHGNQASTSIRQVGASAGAASSGITNANGAVRNLSTQTFTLANNSRQAAGGLTSVSSSSQRAAGSLVLLNNSTNRTAASAGSLNRSITNVNNTVNNYIQVVNNAASATSNLATQANSASGVLDKLKGVFGGLASVATGLVIADIADRMQNLHSQVKLVTSSTEEYNAVSERLTELSLKNNKDIEATTSLYVDSAKSLSQYGKSQEQILTFTESIAMAMSAGGKGIQEQNSAITQLGQAMQSGVLQGDEFKSIAESAPILLDLVASSLKKSRGEVKAMASEGKITAEVVYNAVANAHGMLEKKVKGMPMTMRQAYTNVLTNAKLFVDKMMNATDGISSKIAKLLTTISLNFDQIAKVAVVGAGLAFLNLASKIDLSAKAMAVLNAVMKANPFVLVATAIVGISTALYGVDDVFNTLRVTVGDFVYTVSTGLNGLSDLVSAFAINASNAIAESNGKSTKSYQGFFSNTQKGFTGTLQGISRVLAAATASLATFFQFVGKVFLNVGKAIYNGFASGFNYAMGILDKMQTGLDSMMSKITDSLNGLITGANNLLEQTPLTWRINLISNEQKQWAKSPTLPLLRYSDINVQGMMANNLDALMPNIDNYFEITGKQVEALSKNTKSNYDLSKMGENVAKAMSKDKGDKGGKGGVGDKENAFITPKEQKAWQRVLENAARYNFDKIEESNGLPSGILAAIHMQESRGNPNAVGTMTRYGRAKGGFQFIDETWKRYGNGSPFDLNNAAQAAGRYLAKLLNQFGGNVQKAMAAYNTGEARLDPNSKKYVAWERIMSDNYARDKNGKGQTYHYVLNGTRYFNAYSKDKNDVLSNVLKAQENQNKEAQKVIQAQRDNSQKFLSTFSDAYQKVNDELRDQLIDIAKSGLSSIEQQNRAKFANAMADIKKELITVNSLKDQYSTPEGRKIYQEDIKSKYGENSDQYIGALNPKITGLMLDTKVKELTKMLEASYGESQDVFDKRVKQIQEMESISEKLIALEIERSAIQENVDNAYKRSAQEQINDKYNLLSIENEIARVTGEKADAEAQRINDSNEFQRSKELETVNYSNSLKTQQYETAIKSLELTAKMEMALLTGNSRDALKLTKEQTDFAIAESNRKWQKEAENRAIENNGVLTDLDKQYLKVQQLAEIHDSINELTRDYNGYYNDPYTELKNKNMLAIEKIKAFMRQEVELRKAHGEDVAELEKANAEKIAQIQDIARNQNTAQMMTTYSNMFDFISDLTTKITGEDSKVSKFMKHMKNILNVASMISQNWGSLTASFSPAGGGGGILSGIFKMVMGAFSGGSSNFLTSIVSSLFGGFSSGGYTGNFARDAVAGVVHGQEYVLNAKATSSIGLPTLNALNSGKSIATTPNINIHNYAGAQVSAGFNSQGELDVYVEQKFNNMMGTLSDPNSHASRMIRMNTTARNNY